MMYKTSTVFRWIYQHCGYESFVRLLRSLLLKQIPSDAFVWNALYQQHIHNQYNLICALIAIF